MTRHPTDVFVPPLVAAILAVAMAVSVIVTRDPAPAEPVRVQVLAEQATPLPTPEITPPPLPTVEPTPVPQAVPRRVAPRPAGARTSGSNYRAPVPANGWVQIPSIRANAPIVRVGLDKNGNMQTPRNARDIAWLDNGTFPGPTRNAILAGHRNWSGKAGTFINLEKLQPGAVVNVGMDGKVYTFAVQWVRQYDPDNAPVDELMGETPVDSVTMVTCGGQFNRSTGHYEMRWVARAELVSVG